MNKVLFAIFAMLLGSVPVMAGVLLEIDSQKYSDLAHLEYQIDSRIIEVRFIQRHQCFPSGTTVSGNGLTLKVGEELYPLSGEITLNLADGGLRLTLSTSGGGFTCQGDFIFRNLFGPHGGANKFYVSRAIPDFVALASINLVFLQLVA